MNNCNCEFCKTHDLYRWAKIIECGCFCHDTDSIIGHDGLCCPYPNGKKSDNPHTNLKPSGYYKKILENLDPEHTI